MLCLRSSVGCACYMSDSEAAKLLPMFIIDVLRHGQGSARTATWCWRTWPSAASSPSRTAAPKVKRFHLGDRLSCRSCCPAGGVAGATRSSSCNRAASHDLLNFSDDFSTGYRPDRKPDPGRRLERRVRLLLAVMRVLFAVLRSVRVLFAVLRSVHVDFAGL